VRAAEGCGRSTGNPRWVRICATTARSSIVASRRSRPPHSGHAKMSSANTRRSKSAQATYVGRTYAAGGAADAGTAPAEPRAGGATPVRRVLDHDRAAVATPARRERAVGEEQVDARAGNDDREFFQQLRRFETERLCPVAPRPAQAQQDCVVRRQLQRVLSDRRTQNVPAQMFEPLGLRRSIEVGIWVDPMGGSYGWILWVDPKHGMIAGR
jgi:hypothetical protein